jgi:hypothetical protein
MAEFWQNANALQKMPQTVWQLFPKKYTLQNMPFF